MEGTSKALRRTSGSRGTTSYRAPELLNHPEFGVYNQKTDIFALGCTLFEIICDRPISKMNLTEEAEVSALVERFPQSETLMIDLRSRAFIRLCLKRTLEFKPQLRPSTRQILGLFSMLQEDMSGVCLDGCTHEGQVRPTATIAMTGLDTASSGTLIEYSTDLQLLN
jgi:serine/threonine protein kinase